MSTEPSSILEQLVSAVTVSSPVNGTVQRKKARGHSNPRSQPVEHVVVDRELMRVAKGALRTGERLRVVSATEVVTEYRP